MANNSKKIVLVTGEADDPIVGADSCRICRSPDGSYVCEYLPDGQWLEIQTKHGECNLSAEQVADQIRQIDTDVLVLVTDKVSSVHVKNVLTVHKLW